MNEYDELTAIKAMRAALPADASGKYDDDELLNIVDMIWDYYEQNGMLDIDVDEDDESDTLLQDLVDYATRMLKKDKGATIDLSHLPAMIQAELDYEESLANEL